MIELRWVIREGDKILQYKSKGTNHTKMLNGITGNLSFPYDTGWVDVPTENLPEITVKDGLLYRNGGMIPLPEADQIAKEYGFPFAEAFVDYLTKGV